MANIINRQQTFSTNGTVTAAGLHNLIDTALVNSAIIKNQQEITTIGTADLLLVAPDSVDSSLAPRKVTVQNLLDDGLTSGTFTTLNLTGALTYGTATGDRTVSTSATITTGTIPNLTAGTTTSTAATITNGTITTGLIPTLTTGTTTSTAEIVTSGTISTLNSTTGTIANLSATTSTFLGEITGSTNVVNIGSGQVYKDASGRVGIGTSSLSEKFNIYDATSSRLLVQGDSAASVISFRASTDAFGPSIAVRKARGTIASQAQVESGDVIGSLFFQAFGGTNTRNCCAIISNVETYTSDANISSNLIFYTSPSGSADGTERLRIASDGQIGIGGANYGTSGQVLTSGGSAAAPSWQTASAISMATATASTTGTAIDFTGIPSTVKRITVMFNGVSTSGVSAFLIQLGSGSITSSGYSSSAANFAATVVTSSTGFILVSGNVAAATYNGHAFITNSSGNSWVETGSMFPSGGNSPQCGGGNVTLSGAIDRLRIRMANGTDTFDAGSINILYES
jgi:hypothetical protein